MLTKFAKKDKCMCKRHSYHHYTKENKKKTHHNEKKCTMLKLSKFLDRAQVPDMKPNDEK